MENTVIESSWYYGKVGVDNLLLILVGLLFFVLAFLRRIAMMFEWLALIAIIAFGLIIFF